MQYNKYKTKFKFPKYGFLLIICGVLMGISVEHGSAPMFFGSFAGAMCAICDWITK